MDKNFVVIAHRGASGYLPEHTLESKAMAYAMGPDFIEQDVVLTKDNRAIVIHDYFLDTVSNVEEVFPDKKRKDGRYYVIDFTLKQIKKLDIHERIDLKKGKAVFSKRFPEKTITEFEISSLDEEIEMIMGLNKSMGKDIGIYTEIKSPWFHKSEGKDIAKTVLDIYRKYGYIKKASNCYIQCFDPESLIYMRSILKTKIKLVQLIADNSWEETPCIDYNKMLTPEGLDEIAEYADAIGPWMKQVVVDKGKGENPEFTDLVKLAHKRNLEVHAYTLRADKLPSYAKDIDELFKVFFIKAGVDGVFTDFPDKGVEFLKKGGYRE